MVAERSIVVSAKVRTPNREWQASQVLLDHGCEINLVSQRYATLHRLEAVPGARIPRVKWLPEAYFTPTAAYSLRIRATDFWGQTREFDQVFYSTQIQGPDIVFGMPVLRQERILVDPTARRYRFGLQESNIELLEPKDLVTELQAGSLAYIVTPTPLTPYREAEGDIRLSPEVRCGAGTTEVLPEALHGFRDVFSEEAAGILPAHKDSDHAIDIEDGATPPHRPLYNLSQTELHVLREYIENALEKGWIQHSTSPAGAPVLFVPKKDGKLRLCVDYRGLNKITIKNRHPLPLIGETLDRLGGAHYFTKLDLKDAYHRIRIRKGDEWKTAFRTRYGHFEYLVMPFGLANAPATFQAYMNKALAGLVDITCVIYLDDILIYSRTKEQHLLDIKEVLLRLRKFGLYASLKKCFFFQEEVEYLGFIVGRQGTSMDPERVRTIEEWPKPTSYRELQVFLGFANFYRRFIEGYSRIVAPLTSLFQGMKKGVKTGVFVWKSEQEAAFQQLRSTFGTTPFLRHFDPERRITVETDASGYALAGILSQLHEDKWRIVAYWSRKMKGAELHYKTHDQELMAIVESFKHWRHYLEGAPQTVRVLSDHNNLRGFMSQVSLNGRQARWAMTLAAYDFVIEHRPGSKNPADGPSRRPDYEADSGPITDRLSELQTMLLKKRARIGAALPPALKEAGDADRGDDLGALLARDAEVIAPDEDRPVIAGAVVCQQLVPRAVVVAAMSGETAEKGPNEMMTEIIRSLHEEEQRNPVSTSDRAGLEREREDIGVLKHQGRWRVPREGSLRMEILRRYHDDPVSGHYGVDKTTERIQRWYHWPNLSEDVATYIRTCDVCQRTKAKRHRPYGELQPLPTPERPWQHVAMDFIVGLPPSRRGNEVYDSILVVVDRMTKMVKYVPTTETLRAEGMSEILFDRVFSTFGVPESVVSDRGSLFTSEFWSTLCYHLQAKRRLSTAYHPQTDGQTERQNQTLEHYLRTFCCETQDDWASWLSLAEFCYNDAENASTRMTPFRACYTYGPRWAWRGDEDITPEEGGQRGKKPEEQHPEAEALVQRHQEQTAALKDRLRAAQEQMKKQYDKTHLPKTFTIGDLVLLRCTNIRLKQPSKKLGPKYIGPFPIEERLGTQAYKLTLPPKYSRIHPVFHVSYLEPYQRRAGAEAPYPGPELVEDQTEWSVEKIVDRGRIDGVEKVKVRWEGYPESYDSWEPISAMENATEALREYEDAHPRRGSRRRRSVDGPDREEQPIQRRKRGRPPKKRS